MVTIFDKHGSIPTTHFMLINSSFSIINFSIPSNHSNNISYNIITTYLSLALAQILQSQQSLVVHQIMIDSCLLTMDLLCCHGHQPLLSQYYGRMGMTDSMEYEHYNIEIIWHVMECRIVNTCHHLILHSQWSQNYETPRPG